MTGLLAPMFVWLAAFSGCADTIEVVAVESVGAVMLTDWRSDDPEVEPMPESPETIVDLGDRPYLVVYGNQCFSSQCTSALFSECDITGPDDNGNVSIRMRIAVEVRDGNGPCSADCARYVAECGRVDVTHATLTFSSPGGALHTLTFPRTLGELEPSE